MCPGESDRSKFWIGDMIYQSCVRNHRQLVGRSAEQMWPCSSRILALRWICSNALFWVGLMPLVPCSKILKVTLGTPNLESKTNSGHFDQLIAWKLPLPMLTMYWCLVVDREAVYMLVGTVLLMDFSQHCTTRLYRTMFYHLSADLKQTFIIIVL